LYSEWVDIVWRDKSRLGAAAWLIDVRKNRVHRLDSLRPKVKGLAWYFVFGPWLPTAAKIKRAILG
jgi:hypothetical protein